VVWTSRSTPYRLRRKHRFARASLAAEKLLSQGKKCQGTTSVVPQNANNKERASAPATVCVCDTQTEKAGDIHQPFLPLPFSNYLTIKVGFVACVSAPDETVTVNE
jgi:hypothetical protein